MNFEEHAAKPLLAKAGIAVPEGRLVTSAAEAAKACAAIGPVVVKAQVPTGKRGKAGGIRLAGNADEAREAAKAILGMKIGAYTVERLLVEEQAAIASELYAAVLNDPESKGPLLMFSAVGGMDIEEIAAERPEALRKVSIDVREGFAESDARRLLEGLEIGTSSDLMATVLAAMYRAYRDNDAELLEINPLATLKDGRVVALDCKFALDDSSIKRQSEISADGTPDRLTHLEARAQELGLKYIELGGEVGVLANGAGLTMTTMDVITYHGGRPANFLEIGGEAYTKAVPALELVLSHPNIRSLVVNFCGAFARTDVMTEGVLDARDKLKPSIPIFFSVHGTGAKAAREMLKSRLGIEPYPNMDAAIVAAIEVAGGGQSDR
jgi:succinyl-CoA synthetase beta subunit